MSNKTYDILKYIAQIALPAFIVLYTAIAGYWNWPIQRPSQARWRLLMSSSGNC